MSQNLLHVTRFFKPYDTDEWRYDRHRLIGDAADGKDVNVVDEYRSRGEEYAISQKLRITEREEHRVHRKGNYDQKGDRPLPGECAERTYHECKTERANEVCLRAFLLKII